MKTYDQTTSCPFCGQAHTAMSDATDHGHVPQPGSVSLCINCGKIGLIDAADDDRLVVRKPTEAEQRDLMADQSIINALAAWMQMKNETT